MRLTTFIAGSFYWASSAIAAPPVDTPVPAQMERLLACRALTESGARLACFDRESQTVASALSGGNLVAVDREKVRSTKKKLFGLSLPDLGLFGSDGEEITQIEGVLAGVGGNRDGGYIFRLQDGARWSQTDSKPIAVPPQAGDKVVIKQGTLGSYFLSVNRQAGVKVTRLN